MEETTTADLSLSYRTYGYGDFEGNVDYECPTPSGSLVVFAGVCVGICLCGLVGNGIVMWSLGFHIKQNPFNIYILNLAVSDFSLLLMFFLLLLAVLMPVAFCLHSFISFYRDFVFVVELLCHFFDLSSLGLLTAISVEQCVSVLFPVWYQCHRPKRLSGVICGVLWAFAGFFVSSMYLSINFAESDETEFGSVDLAISMILSSMMLISDLFLFIKLRCGSRRRHPGKLYIAVLLNMIFFFIALGIPFSVEVFLDLSSSHELFSEITSLLLPLLSCGLDPVVYFLVGSCRQRRVQCSVKVTFQQLFEEKVTTEEENPVPGETVTETTV